MLYPEDPYNLNKVKDKPDHLFFKTFGMQVPAPEWNTRGTKQGIYFMGPNAEYLEAKFATAPAADIRARMMRALTKWDQIKAEKGYKNTPVPEIPEQVPPEVRGKAMILRASLRDLPATSQDSRGGRYEQVGGSETGWTDFGKWAWNQNWVGFDIPRNWVATSGDWEPVSRNSVFAVAKHILVDNVRGQGGPWPDQAVKKAEINMRVTARTKAEISIEYKGLASMDTGNTSYTCTIYGLSRWNPETEKFASFDLVTTGIRRGKWQFNQRENDLGPAAMGIVLSLFK